MTGDASRTYTATEAANALWDKGYFAAYQYLRDNHFLHDPDRCDACGTTRPLCVDLGEGRCCDDCTHA